MYLLSLIKTSEYIRSGIVQFDVLFLEEQVLHCLCHVCLLAYDVERTALLTTVGKLHSKEKHTHQLWSVFVDKQASYLWFSHMGC